MNENEKKLHVSQNTDKKIEEVLNNAMVMLAENGIDPIIIIARLPDGSTIDMSNSAICGKCIAVRLKQISEVYHAKNPKHLNEDPYHLN